MSGHRVLYNENYGGFRLSEGVCERIGDKTLRGYNVARHDPTVLAAVNEVGLEAAAGVASKLEVAQLEVGDWYHIKEYDGAESVHERVQMQVYCANDTSDTRYTLSVSLQELYDAGFIKEAVAKHPPKSAASASDTS